MRSTRLSTIPTLTLIVLASSWVGGAKLAAQSRTAHGALTVQVRPEELMRAQAGGVLLKIRLARGATARLWAADACGAVPPQAEVVAASGVYNIPLSSLAAGPSGSGRTNICLISSDGELKDSVAVNWGAARPAEMPESFRMQVGSTPTVPPGTIVTTQGSTTTASDP